MIVETSKVNSDTLMLLPLGEADTTEVIKLLYDRGVKLPAIELAYNCLDDYYQGKDGA